ncbi:hypothetical protein [Salinibius halmophilus]|uniref:hypothetical protein n=1 Tax=Salinibius halmophilus TaxID=1853216 RepID=UPI000E67264F|nr:hypothetical protein [Salinibius halmophilus]
MLKRTLIGMALCAGAASVSASNIDSFPYAVGIQGADGLSFKAQMSPDLAAQLIVDPFGSYNRVIARGILDIEQGTYWKGYGYADGGVHLGENDGTAGADTLGIGIGAGLGLQYDIRGLAVELPPVAVSFDVGGGAIFYNNDAPFGLHYSLGLHYHF